MKIGFLLAAMALVSLTYCQKQEPTTRASILGDSYSTHEGTLTKSSYLSWYRLPPNNKNDVTSIDQVWWHQVFDTLNWTLETNNSYSGATICNTGYDGADNKKISFVARMNELGKPDVILVFGGTNDSWAGSPVGEYKYSNWTDEDLYSFRPAMAKLCDGLNTMYPDASAYFILNDCLDSITKESIHVIAGHYDIPCIDLAVFDKQDGHPSVAGMRSITNQLIGYFRKQ